MRWLRKEENVSPEPPTTVAKKNHPLSPIVNYPLCPDTSATPSNYGWPDFKITLMTVELPQPRQNCTTKDSA